MDICIRIPRSTAWTSSVSRVTPAIRDAYVEYKERPHYYRETPYLSSEYIVYRPDNDPYLPTYIARIADIPALYHVVENRPRPANNNNNNIIITREIHESADNAGLAIPIIDMNDISVFIVDNPAMTRANWASARPYQAWAYRDFMYDPHRSARKSYMSRNTASLLYESNANILANQIVTIDVANISPNIVFNLSRNENNSVYFERNDSSASRTRICDNEYTRAGYLGFYTRITMDPGMIVIPPPLAAAAASSAASTALLSIAHLPDPEETDDEEHQCIMCFKYRVNARFSPCEHKVSCSACYSKMTKNECPVCRANITRVMNV
jgi:hypothetical protein